MIKNILRNFKTSSKSCRYINDIKLQCNKLLQEDITHTPGRVKIINSIIKNPHNHVNQFKKFDKDMFNYLEYLYIMNYKCS